MRPVTHAVFDPGLESITVAETLREFRESLVDARQLPEGVAPVLRAAAATESEPMDVADGDNRLLRPVARYVGGDGRTWMPVEKR